LIRRGTFLSSEVLHAICSGFKVPYWLMMHIPLARTHSYVDAPINRHAVGRKGCPVAIFAHSLGGMRTQVSVA
jgi:hypothetical protein